MIVPPPKRDGPMGCRAKPSMAPHLKAMEKEQKNLKNASDWWQSSNQWSSWDWKRNQWSNQGERHETKFIEREESHTDAVQHASNEYELVCVEDEQGHLGEASGHRFRSISPSPVSFFHKRRSRRQRARTSGRACRAFSKPKPKRATGRSARYAKLDNHKQGQYKMDVEQLRYSQLSCKDQFRCGRSVVHLIQDLWDGVVDVTAPFLRLTVFETIDEKTNEPIVKSIDNRRLYALKQYALLMEEQVMVNVDFFSLNTLTQVQRIIENSDETDGRDVRLRKNRSNKRCQPLI